MDISIIGTGYVGLVTGAGFAEKGNNVVCVDVVKGKVDVINSGRSPIYEKGLDEILKRNIGSNLVATTDLRHAVLSTDITFICVGTPSREDGSLDLGFVKKASGDVGGILSGKDYHVVVVKSTVLPGTTERTVIPVIEEKSGKKFVSDFGVGVNPEFLREGIAVEDFMNPDRVVIGSSDKRSEKIIGEVYSNFGCPVLKTNIKTAEMIKYSSNSFLAAKVSFINEIGNICKKLGINVYDVAEGISLDHRVSPHFLSAGLGWGGSCFPKDLKALIYEAKELGYEPSLLNAVLGVNMEQPRRLLDIARKKVGSFSGKKIAVLGLAFKGGTDDTRDSMTFPVIEGLLGEGARVVAYDPEAEDNARVFFGDRITYADSAEDSLKDSDLALIVTDWKEFEYLDYGGMRSKVVVDSRNIVKNRQDIDYEGLCW
ncbi:MAG: UDP-glucose/GDP-mannose dehydrogenase family protein [Candidatus Altiarchaeota archaeon]|nr:UDP-glucose/GDP-mannose dehydrogenase family protein [Candidatus Altiarchaeota archaeon]